MLENITKQSTQTPQKYTKIVSRLLYIDRLDLRHELRSGCAEASRLLSSASLRPHPKRNGDLFVSLDICRRWVSEAKTRDRPPEGVVGFTGKLCRNAAFVNVRKFFPFPNPFAFLFSVALFQVLSQSVSLHAKKYCQRHPWLALHRNEFI